MTSDFRADGPWYHGSPVELTVLRAGTMVTPFQATAKAFSHKPRFVSFGDTPEQVQHDGQVPGILYVVDETLAPADLRQLPGTASTHWEARRDLKLKRLRDVPVDDPPQLSAQALARMEAEHAEAGGGSGMVVGPTREAALVFRRLRIRGEALDALTPHWEEDEAGRPATLSFLDPSVITRHRAYAQLPAALDPILHDVARRIAASPELTALAWHCHQLLYAHPDYPVHAQTRHWPAPLPGLDDDTGVLYLLLGLDAIPRMVAAHRRLDVPNEITRAGVSHYPASLHRYAEHHDGRVGVRPGTLYWLRNHIRGDLFRLGRHEYMLKPFRGRLLACRHRDTRAVVALAADGAPFDADGYMTTDPEAAAWTAGLQGWHDEDARAAAASSAAGMTTGRPLPRAVTGHPISPRGHAERRRVTLDRDAWEIALVPGDTILEMHIPEGGGMTPAACRASMRQALTFFPRFFPHMPYVAFACSSWILNPQIDAVYRPDSNMVLWQRELYLYPTPNAADARSGLYFLVGTDDVDPATAPRDTSLRRAVLDHLAAGGRLLGGGMFLLPEDFERFGTRPYRTQDLPV